jgi:hypothetical protein
MQRLPRGPEHHIYRQCERSICDMVLRVPHNYEFLIAAKDLTEKLQKMEEQDAVVVRLLDDGTCADFVRASQALPYRPAKPVIGEGDKAVYQDFVLCYDLPEESPFRGLAAKLEDLIQNALSMASPPLFAEQFLLNDLILQHYPKGSKGITPHRDHLRYRGLVALVILAGQGDFYLCDDRQGKNPRAFASGKGDLLLMRAPGFGSREDRPFHYLSDIRSDRLSFGCRYDVRTEPSP